MKREKRNIIFFLFLCLGLFLIIFFFYQVKISHLKYSYKIQRNSSYSVKLKPNSFYESNLLSTKTLYPSLGVDYYTIGFEYHYKGQESKAKVYKYQIKATLLGTSKENVFPQKEIWTRSYSLTDKETKKIKDNEFLIKEDVKIDYPFYHQLVKSYQASYDVLMSAILKVELKIEYYIDSSSKKINDAVTLQIPVGENITTVKETYQKTTLKKTNLKSNSYLYLILGNIFLLSCIFILIKNNSGTKNSYQKHLQTYFKASYEKVIKLQAKPDFKNIKKIFVSTFQDLIDASWQLKRPILYYELIPRKEGDFYVLLSSVVYIYQIKS